MAKDKNSFVLYADLLKSVDHLTDEELGKLFRHILEYVNDLNPVMEDRLLLTAWKPIERSLKEDLKKWEEIRTKRAEAGAKGGKAKQANAKSVKQNVANQAVSVTDTVSDNVINNTIPSIEEFMAYGLSKMDDVDKEALRLKYESWKVNGWCTNKAGKEQKIKNWKSTLLNTLKYLPKQPINNGLQKPQKLKDLYD